MKTLWFAALAALTLVFPAAAQAQDGPKLDCAITAMAPDLRASIGRALAVDGDSQAREKLFGQLSAVTGACAAKAGFDPNTYYNYSLARIGRDWMIPELRRYSLDTAVIDKLFDFGPSGANPDTSELGEDQLRAMLAAFREGGVDIEKVPEGAWEIVGVYIASTAMYWRSRALLTR